jgi:hypothetical protein
VLTFVTESRQLAGLGELRFMLISVVIVLVLLFARSGIWGAVESVARLIRRGGGGDAETGSPPDQEAPANMQAA